MNLSPVILAIPLFFGLIGVELVYEAISRKKTYRLNDAVTNINLGGAGPGNGCIYEIA